MKDTINQILVSLIPSSGSSIFEAAQYSLHGGKRLRPLLVLATMEAFGCLSEKGLHPACALELVHTYSLIHDDLPCMDDDDFRRGKPTLHKAFSESLAVLTGDFLLTRAFEVISQAPYVTGNKKIRLLGCLSQRSGINGMIGGQVLDIEEKNWDEEKISTMQKMKTGSLFTAAFEFGGILSDQKNLTLFQEIGETFGEAYQIADDLKDEDGATRILRKEIMEQKRQKLLEKFQDLLSNFPKESLLFKELIEGLTKTTTN